MKVIAVDGHSAAGKSTFAEALAQSLHGSLVHGDDFYRVMDPVGRGALSPEEGALVFYDWERMLNAAIEPLMTGRAASFRPYDWERDDLAHSAITIEPSDVVIVEGLFVSRPELQHAVDFSVLVSAPAEVRHRRQLSRADATVSWLERWDAAERWFFDHIRTEEQFDLVINTDRCDDT